MYAPPKFTHEFTSVAAIQPVSPAVWTHAPEPDGPLYSQVMAVSVE
jgi:hypothetical protein